MRDIGEVVKSNLLAQVLSRTECHNADPHIRECMYVHMHTPGVTANKTMNTAPLYDRTTAHAA